MFFYTISIAAAIFILMIVVSRMLIHFYFCRRVSFRYPGEKIKGCPIWTHAGQKGNGENGGGKQKATTAAASTQHMCVESKDSREVDEATGRQQQHFNNLFPATPPGN